MEYVFIRILNMSLTSVFVILAVLLARFFLKKSPKIFSYALWGVVLFRLLCPVSFSSPFSLLGVLKAPVPSHGQITYIPEHIALMEQPHIDLPGQTASNMINNSLPVGKTENSVYPMQLILSAGTVLWLTGLLLLFFYSIAAYGKLQKTLKGAVQKEPEIYTAPQIATPFVCGILSPRIYLPCLSNKTQENYILTHEKIHIRRGDHLWRLISYLTLCLHWFNPLVWAAFFLSGKDMEMSCDEAVIKKLGNKVKKEYSASLLAFACGPQTPWKVPPAFGEGEIKGRIKNLFLYKKTGKITAIFAMALCLLIAVFLTANPQGNKRNSSYSCYDIPIGDGRLQWGMSSDQVSAVLGTPSHMETQSSAHILTYDTPVTGSLGICSQTVLYIGIDNLGDDEPLSSGLGAIIMTMEDTSKESMLGKLADFYGPLSPEGGETLIEIQLKAANPDYFYQYHFCDEWKAETLPENSFHRLTEIYSGSTETPHRILDKDDPLMYINLWGVDHYSCTVQLNASVLACYLQTE